MRSVMPFYESIGTVVRRVYDLRIEGPPRGRLPPASDRPRWLRFGGSRAGFHRSDPLLRDDPFVAIHGASHTVLRLAINQWQQPQNDGYGPRDISACGPPEGATTVCPTCHGIYDWRSYGAALHRLANGRQLLTGAHPRCRAPQTALGSPVPLGQATPLTPDFSNERRCIGADNPRKVPGDSQAFSESSDGPDADRV